MNINNVKFLVGDAERLSMFSDNTFDGVISFSTLRYKYGWLVASRPHGGYFCIFLNLCRNFVRSSIVETFPNGRLPVTDIGQKDRLFH